MKKTDMELQAIRDKLEKLQLLRDEPTAAEPQPLPWSAAKSSSLSSTDEPSGSRPALAIETLKQRSLSSDQAANAHSDHLIAQEIYRLEVQAIAINERSRQQSAELEALKRSAQQATVALARQGIQEHPLLETISELFAEYPSAVVPFVGKDDQGHFTLIYETIDFQRAEKEAVGIAHSLRQRSPILRQAPFAHPIDPSPNRRIARERATLKTADDRPPMGLIGLERAPTPKQAMSQTVIQWVQIHIKRAQAAVMRLLWQGHRHRAKSAFEGIEDPEVGQDLIEGPMGSTFGNYLSNDQFSLLDGTIWFSCAAILRVAIEAIASSYPLLRVSLWVGLIGVVGFALYQLIVSNASNYSAIYRLLVAILGLFLAGFLF